MYRIGSYFLILLLIFGVNAYGQQTNTDAKKSYINIDLPRTPESQGFEKYGNIPVSEFTGSANISIPLYDLKSRFINVPISLSCASSGIRVSQEASWCGLGWDLNVGGRITVETKGSIDNDQVNALLYSQTELKSSMQQIFTRLGGSSESGVLTYASTCFTCYQGIPSPFPGTPDNWGAANAMAQFGVGEPDIFHANFMGQSFSFYFDIITGSLKFIGEKTLFGIDYNIDSYKRITDWTITDNSGIKYFFAQKELTSTTPGTNTTFFGTATTSAWLLTRVLHPSGDEVNFTYSNYGNSYPAYNWNASLSRTYELPIGVAPDPPADASSQDNNQNPVTQQPYYLTKIETAVTTVNFLLGNRTDLNGGGSKKIDTITVIDKPTNTEKKRVTFGYDYFNNMSGCYINSLSDAACTSRYNMKRLKLTSVVTNDVNGLTPPYKFYYYENNGQIPSKYSFDQDHWGYYNAANNNSYSVNGNCTPQNMIPWNETPFHGFAASRECNPTVVNVMSLESIEYPTGGKTSFVYEPHQSSNGITPTGGGLRIKTMKNYSQGKLAGFIEYTYQLGIYQGAINYQTKAYKVQADQGVTVSSPHNQMNDILSSNGAVNDNDYLVGYPVVTKTEKDADGKTNGYEIKTFNISNGTGYQTRQPTWPSGIYYGTNGTIYWDELNRTSMSYLYPFEIAPTPIKQLDGKLMQDQLFDATGNLIKSIDYSYHQEGYSNDFYDIKVKDNSIGSYSPAADNAVNGARRFVMFVSPSKSFFTHTDKIVEKTYSGSNSITSTKTYQYNGFHQPVYEAIGNSDGTQTITYTKTAAEMGTVYRYNLPANSDGNKLMNMFNAHIYDLPVEQTVVNTAPGGNPMVVSSRLNVYNGVFPEKVYIAQTAQPLAYGSQFVPVFYNYIGFPSYPPGDQAIIKIDDHYKLYSSADYASSGLINTIHSLQGNTAYIWDDSYNNLMAQCTNADVNNIAATSFETKATGRWSYAPNGVVTELHAPTGNNAYNLNAGSISLSGLNATKTYVVSYWSKSGNSYSVIGSTTPIKGRSYNEWTYYEHAVSGITSLTITGGNNIDELRLHPSDAQMISYTYEPLRGITSQCDASNKIAYYSYDVAGRLQYIKDQDGNIIKTISYHNQSIPGFQH